MNNLLFCVLLSSVDVIDLSGWKLREYHGERQICPHNAPTPPSLFLADPSTGLVFFSDVCPPTTPYMILEKVSKEATTSFCDPRRSRRIQEEE